MYINDQDEIPDDPAARWPVALFLALVLGLFAADALTNYEPAKASALFVVLWWIPLLFLHEFAHAFMSWSCGWQVQRIVIGFGKPFWVFEIFGARTEFRRIPIGGYIQPVPGHLRQPRFREFLIYAAGPGSELLASLMVFLVVGPERIFTRSDDYLLIAAQSLIVAALVQSFANLFPHGFITTRQKIANDGLGMILCWWRTDDDYQERIEAFRRYKAWEKG